MKRRPPGLKTEMCFQGFLQFKTAEGLSPRTIASYRHDLYLWLELQGDFDVSRITSQDLRAYLVYMLNEYTPRRITGNTHIGLSPKTIRNIWVSLCAFFRWINEEFDLPNPMKKVAAPKFENAPVEPFTREDIETLLKACDYCQEAQTNNRRKFTMHRHTASRDRALILTLLDSGLRASELCSLKIGEVDIKPANSEIRSPHPRASSANGAKEDHFSFSNYMIFSAFSSS